MVEKFLDMVDREESMVHGDGDGVPNLRDKRRGCYI
jgi:hypothetical protein